jgi:hypothetical protein
VITDGDVVVRAVTTGEDPVTTTSAVSDMSAAPPDG